MPSTLPNTFYSRFVAVRFWWFMNWYCLNACGINNYYDEKVTMNDWSAQWRFFFLNPRIDSIFRRMIHSIERAFFLKKNTKTPAFSLKYDKLFSFFCVRHENKKNPIKKMNELGINVSECNSRTRGHFKQMRFVCFGELYFQIGSSTHFSHRSWPHLMCSLNLPRPNMKFLNWLVIYFSGGHLWLGCPLFNQIRIKSMLMTLRSIQCDFFVTPIHL